MTKSITMKKIQTMIQINLTKKLHGSEGEMLLDAKLKIQKNDFVALTGLSGSGKTTLLRILAGLGKLNRQNKSR